MGLLDITFFKTFVLKQPGLLSWPKPEKRLILKITSLLVIISLVLPYLGFAFTSLSYPANAPGANGIAPVKINGKKITIPLQRGLVTSSYQGNSPLTVVCVQDLHCNYEVQSNIAAIIKTLSLKNQLNLIAVEGESQAVDVSKLSTIPVKRIREKVGKYFLRRGLISGAEYQTALNHRPLLLQGIESKKIYDESKQLLNQFFNDETQGYCEDLRDAMEDLKPVIYNESLARIDHQHTAFRYNKIDFMAYAKFLLMQARQTKHDLAPYAELNHYVENIKLSAPHYQAHERLTEQAKQLEKDLRHIHYTSDAQVQLDHYLEILDIIENLINISASQKQLEYFSKHRDNFAISAMLKFIQSTAWKVGEDALLYDVLSLNTAISLAERFYGLVDKRSQVFVKKLTRLMKLKQESLAVMVTGGFHTSRIEELLKENDISFITVKPHLTKTDMVNPYFSLLRDQKSPLEMLLAKKEGFFSLWSSFGTKLFEDHIQFIVDTVLNYELYLSGRYQTPEAQERFRQEFETRYTANELKFNFDRKPTFNNDSQTVLAIKFEIDSQVYFAVLRDSRKFNATSDYSMVLKESLGAGVQLRVLAPEQLGVEVTGDQVAIIDQALFDQVMNPQIRQSLMARIKQTTKQIIVWFQNIPPLPALNVGSINLTSGNSIAGISILAIMSGSVFLLGDISLDMIQWLTPDNITNGTKETAQVLSPKVNSETIIDLLSSLSVAGSPKLMRQSRTKSLNEIKKSVNEYYKNKVATGRTAKAGLKKFFKSGREFVLSIGEIDSFAAYEKIYGQEAARFLYEVTLHELQEKSKKNSVYIYRTAEETGRFGIAFIINAAQAMTILRQLQLEIHNELRRRFQVLTLGLSNEFGKARSLGINQVLKDNKLLGLAFVHKDRLHLLLGSHHMEDKSEARESVERFLKKSNLLEENQSLRDMVYDVPEIKGYNDNYMPDPKLTIALSPKLPGDIVVAEISDGKAEINRKTNKKLEGIENRVTKILNHHHRTQGGQIILLSGEEAQILAGQDSAIEYFKFDRFQSEKEAAIYLYHRYVQLFETWFLSTAQRLAEREKQTPVKGMKNLLELYNNNLYLIEESSLAFIDAIHYYAIQLAKVLDEQLSTSATDKEVAANLLGQIKAIMERKQSREYQGQLARILGKAYGEVLQRIDQVVNPDQRKKESERLQEIINNSLDDLSFETDIAPPRIKKANSILGNFIRYWKNGFTEEPDFTQPDIYTKKNILKIVDDLIGCMIYVNNIDEMNIIYRKLYNSLTTAGYKIEEFTGTGVYLKEGEIVTDSGYYYDFMIKLPPGPNLELGAEIKLVERTLDDGTRPGYRVRKEGLINKQNWLIGIIGQSTKMRQSVAKKAAEKLNYTYLDMNQIKQAIAYVIRQNPDKQKPAQINRLIYKLDFDHKTEKILYDGKEIKQTELREGNIAEINHALNGKEKVINKLLSDIQFFKSRRKVIIEADRADLKLFAGSTDYILELQASDQSLSPTRAKYEKTNQRVFSYTETKDGNYSSQAINGLVKRINRFLGDQVAGTRKKSESHPVFDPTIKTLLAVIAICLGGLEIALAFMSYSPPAFAGMGVNLIQTMNLPGIAAMVFMIASGLYLIKWGRGQLTKPIVQQAKPIAQIESAQNYPDVIKAIKHYQKDLGLKPGTFDARLGWFGKMRLNWINSRIGSYLNYQQEWIKNIFRFGSKNKHWRQRFLSSRVSPVITAIVNSSWFNTIDISELQQAGELGVFMCEWLLLLEAIESGDDRLEGLRLLSAILYNTNMKKVNIHVENLGILTLPASISYRSLKRKFDFIIKEPKKIKMPGLQILRSITDSA